MALRLGRSINQERNIPVGYGVSFSFKPFSFAQYREARAAAHKMARSSLSMKSQMAVETIDDEDMPEEVEHEIQGQFDHALLLLLIMRYCQSWEGLLTENEGAEEQAPLEIGYVESLLAAFPGVADFLSRQLLLPYQIVEQEGNGSAPSPSGASAAG